MEAVTGWRSGWGVGAASGGLRKQKFRRGNAPMGDQCGRGGRWPRKCEHPRSEE